MKRENARFSGKKRDFSSLGADQDAGAAVPLHALPRLFVAADLAAGGVVTLDSNQTHYLAHVLRRESGDSIRVFNGLHGDWRATWRVVKKGVSEITLVNQLVAQVSSPDVTLYCAPIKKAHFDDMVMKATELGVTRIQPVLTARTQIREVNTNRVKEIAREAAEQSERLSLPIIEEVQGFDWLLRAFPASGVLVYCAEHGAARPVGEALTALGATTNHKPSFGILVGPEGGVTVEEMAALNALPFGVPVRLGPRILRADTAALAALACWQALCGDWVSDTDTNR